MTDQLEALAALIDRERDALLSDWRRQVRQLPSAASLDVPTLNDHIPMLVQELAVALRARETETIPEALTEGSPPAHGTQRAVDGYDIVELVAEYNILRGCIHDLAGRAGLVLQGRPFHILNRVLDGAIGIAVETYAAERAREVQQRRDEHLAFVAHDLRTPLNAISLVLKIVELKVPLAQLGPDAPRLFGALERNVAQLEELVTKVLDETTSSLADGGVDVHLRSFYLWPLVESVLHDLEPMALEAGSSTHNDVPDDLVVWADASLLRRVFQNLLANAMKHTRGGAIRVGATELGAEHGTECHVSDDGSGIDPERIDAIFDKFETDDPLEGGGVGLGLAIVKSFVEAHGGVVSVESVRGDGATFRFTLPARKR